MRRPRYEDGSDKKGSIRPNWRLTMTTRSALVALLASAAAFGTVLSVQAQVSEQTLKSLSTPDKVESPIGTLEFKDGGPSPQTVQKAFDALDFNHALGAYLNSYGGAIPRPLPKRTRTARRRSISVRRSLMSPSRAIGSRPCPARAGSRSCASTAHSKHSSRKSGARARSSW
jgi:hypothetical protein